MLHETWMPVSGFNYEVSSEGRVRSLFKGLVLTPRIHSNGYHRVTLSNNGIKVDRYIHRLVAAAFLVRPEDHNEVNHKNADKTDNRAVNLEWSNRTKNVRHALGLGLYDKARRAQAKAISGSLNKGSRHTEEQVLTLRRLHQEGAGPAELAKLYGTNISTLEDILYRRSWRHI